ncbi:MAG: hypothetical protein DIZ77_16805, partial [endosymbiont of Seepiophila jonesi]
MATRKQYTKEFKLDAVSLVVDQGYSRSEAARSLDINAQMLGRWVKELQSDDGQAFRKRPRIDTYQFTQYPVNTFSCPPTQENVMSGKAESE